MPIIVGQKIIGGFLALLFLSNIVIGNTIGSKIYNHKVKDAYVEFIGKIVINKEKHNLIIQLEDNIIDDKTPGRFRIIIENKKGEKVEIDHDYGSGEKSDFDRDCEEKIINSIIEYIDNMKDKSLRDRLSNFTNYCNKEKRSIIKRFFR